MRTSRRGWPAVGWGTWIAAAAAAAVILTCTLSSLAWINRPFPGFFLWENLFVPAVGDTDWTGYEAGLPFQSHLVAVNGKPVSTAVEVYGLAASLPVGTAVRYTFTPRAAAPVTLTIPTMRFSLAEYLWTLGNYLAVGALLTVLGFVVYVLRPDAPAAVGMRNATVTWGLYLVASADIFGPGWFRPLFFVLQAVGPVTLVHLALTFPVERQLLRRYPRVLRMLYLAGFAVGALNNLVFRQSVASILLVDRLIPLGGVILIALLVHAFFFPPSAAARQRVKIAALGGCAAFLVPVAGFFLFYFRGISFPLNFVTIPMALFPITIGYAIVMHDLFEVDAFIRRTVAWVILTVMIATLYLGGVGILEVLFTGRGGRVAQLGFLLAIVALFNPLRNRVQAAVDFLFARDRYDYRRTVAETSQALVRLLDLEAVVSRILRTITDTIHVDFGAVWLRQNGDGYRLQAVGGSRQADAPPQRLAEDHVLVRQLERHPQSILIQEDGAESGDGAALEELRRLGATLVVPMTFERQLTGLLALGDKESGSFYSSEDLGLLRTLANQGAVAVENARSYRALVHANEELRAAQSRLIEAERFAAIGELSAAVAHGIRNPLAGIKAAAQFAKLEMSPDHPLHENVTDIIAEADKLEARIKTLLDFAKPFEPHPAPCSVSRIVADAAASLRSHLTAQRIELSVDLDAALPDALLDYAQIEQVLLALMSNAVEAMPAGGRIAVTGRLTADGQRLRLEIADTGPGIPPDQLARVFNLFFTTKSSGTGLGLPVAKKIVERHGGTIAIESTVGQGTRFTIELPLGPRAD